MWFLHISCPFLKGNQKKEKKKNGVVSESTNQYSTFSPLIIKTPREGPGG